MTLQHEDVKASVAAVDEEEGIVLLWMNFGDTNSYGSGNALVTFEGLQGMGRGDSRDQRVLPHLPKDTQRSWPSAE